MTFEKSFEPMGWGGCQNIVTEDYMEPGPENHMFEKEHHLPNLHDFGFHVSFPGSR